LDPDNVPIINLNDSDSDSDNSSTVEILDSGSDTDICEETELMKFSRILSDAQKKALAEEKAKGKKRKTYQGLSRTTIYRQNKRRKDLTAQGHLPIDEFMERMVAHKKKEELTIPQDLMVEESEESSDDNAAAVPRLRSNEPDTSNHCQVVRGLAMGEGHRRAIQALKEEEEGSTGSEEEQSNTRENRQEQLQDDARRNGMHTQLDISDAGC
jgi:hypothetical protein